MQELIIRSESIERMYSFYRDDKFIVNRRYQRKLVWNIEEKELFIESIINEFPVPLFLLAEGKNEDQPVFEIIDGMQRLNAIFSFIENEFSVHGVFFDLESMAETKLLKDEGVILQKTPVMDRKTCADKIASYVLPISSYRSTNENTIDDIFRRINANGKHLSRQEIRQAGSLSLFSESVRKISSEIRGDILLGDRIKLSDMNKISITSRDLSYGICVDKLFWVSNGIIRRDQVRESKDEEIIADIISSIVSESMPRSSSKTLDEYYGIVGDGKRAKELDTRISIYGYEHLHDNFFETFNEINSLLIREQITFNELISKTRSFDKVPRYFQIIFLAFYELIIKEKLKMVSQQEVLKVLDGITDRLKLSQGGGNWSAIERENSVNAVKGMLGKCFVKNPEDPALVKWTLEFENILRNSSIEQYCFEFKIGFYDLYNGNWNQNVFEKSIKTLTGMANKGKGSIGYVIIGVADCEKDAKNLKNLKTSYDFINYYDHYITGINHDVDCSGMSLDKYFERIIQELEKLPIDDLYKSYIIKNIRIIKYGNKDIMIFKIMGLDKPASYGTSYFERAGSNVREIPATEVFSLFSRFQ